MRRYNEYVLSVRAAAQAGGLNIKVVQDAIQSGELPSAPYTDTRVRPADLDSWLLRRSHAMATATPAQAVQQ